MNMNLVAMIAGGLVLGTAVVVPMEFNQAQPQVRPGIERKIEQPTLAPQVVEESTGTVVRAESLTQVKEESTPIQTPTATVDPTPISVPSYSTDDDDDDDDEGYEDHDDDDDEHEDHDD